MQQLKMYRPPMEAPEVKIPEGWHIRSYQAGDGADWCLCCRGGALGVDDEASEAVFQTKMLDDPHVAAEDVLFIVDEKGFVGGTTTLYCRDEADWGTVHMVAVKKEAQGKGLSAPVVAAVIARSLEKGRDHITLTTDDFRVPAVKTYLRLGFLPVVGDMPMRRRWQALLTTMGYERIACVDENYQPIEDIVPLFDAALENWTDWSRHYQDHEAFAGVVEAIHAKHDWPMPEAVEALTPGTNYVVKCGERVLKIYAPASVGMTPETEQAGEIARVEAAIARGVPTPAVLARGCIRTKYDFFYTVMEYAPGQEAGDWLKAANDEEKQQFCQQLTGVLCALHGATVRADMEALKQRALENPRWKPYSETFRREAAERLNAMLLGFGVECHGDLTGENILVQEGKLTVLDFADGCTAPFWYEWPPLFADLLQGQGKLIAPFLLGMEHEYAAQLMADALLLHDFGADILRKGMLPQMKKEKLPQTLEELRDICREYLAEAFT